MPRKCHNPQLSRLLKFIAMNTCVKRAKTSNVVMGVSSTVAAKWKDKIFIGRTENEEVAHGYGLSRILRISLEILFSSFYPQHPFMERREDEMKEQQSYLCKKKYRI